MKENGVGEARVETIYAELKKMAVNFRIRPGERINEVELAKELNASRTPLREALNRLVAEQLISSQPGKGFFCRELDVKTIYELYELRAILEEAAIRRACERASDEELLVLKNNEFAAGLAHHGMTIGETTAADEAFHLAIARLGKNDENVRLLNLINERIRFIRWVDMSTRVKQTKSEHSFIMEALEARDAERAGELMRAHIVKRMDQIVTVVREGYSSIYVAGPEELFTRRFRESD